MKKISIDLSVSSIEKAIKEIEEYKAELQKKCNVFLTELVNAGYKVAQATLMAIPEEEKKDTMIEVIQESNNSFAISMHGEKFLFVEFGAGIAFSQPQNPKASEFGMGLGTYPDQTHAYQEEGWWYTAEDGQSKHSRGNAPYMPMYKAGVEIRRQVSQIAKEVFGG